MLSRKGLILLLILISGTSITTIILLNPNLLKSSSITSIGTSPLPMSNFWAWRYMSPSSSDCTWLAARAAIVYADNNADKTCFTSANPNIITGKYALMSFSPTDANPGNVATYNALNAGGETNFLHLTTTGNPRAYWTVGSNTYYAVNLTSPSVRSAIATNYLPQYASAGVSMMYFDDAGTMVEGGYDLGYWNWANCCVEYPHTGGGTPNPVGSNTWIQAYAKYLSDMNSFFTWIRGQVSTVKYIVGNWGSYWYFFSYPVVISGSTLTIGQLNSQSYFKGGGNGVFLEFSPSDTDNNGYTGYQIVQSNAYAISTTSSLEFFAGSFTSNFWFYAYYQAVRNYTTNNLYFNLGYNYPVPNGFVAGNPDGWNSTLWETLNLGIPTQSLKVTIGDTYIIYTRQYPNGFIAVVSDSNSADARTFNTTLPQTYINFKTGKLVSSVLLQAHGAFVGCTTSAICANTPPPPPPINNPTVTFTTPTITAGQSASFTASATGGTPPYTSYAWTVSSNATGSTTYSFSGATLTYTFTGGLKYTVSVTVTDSASKTGLASTSFIVASTGSTTPPPPIRASPDFSNVSLTATMTSLLALVVYVRRRR